MDPEVALAMIRQYIASGRKCQAEDTDDPSYCVIPNDVFDGLAEHFEALDGWLKSGGFKPKDWV